MTQAPVLFLIFNRPHETTRVFEAIRRARPSRLYIAADGPRSDKPGEEVLCEKTRRVVEPAHIDWPCEVSRLFRSENLGCGRAVSEAISWFFDREELGLIIEDDILPGQDFFRFCDLLLEEYRSDSRVMHINGSNYLYRKPDLPRGYYASRIPHIWGWATWRRAWQHYSFRMPGSAKDYDSNANFWPQHLTGRDRRKWAEVFARTGRMETNTWDYQWTYAVWKGGGLCLTPEVNLVSNLGLNKKGTHGLGLYRPVNHLTPEAIKGDIVNPDSLEVRTDRDRFVQRHNFFDTNPLRKWIERLRWMLTLGRVPPRFKEKAN